MLDYFQILGLDYSATYDEIKTAYRVLAKKLHPDIVGDNKEKLLHFEVIKNAYETLSNPTLRYQYYEQRWLQKSKGLHLEHYTPVSAPLIIKTLLKIEQDAYFADSNNNVEEKTVQNISAILHEKNMDFLLQQNDADIQQTIANILINIIPFVPFTYLTFIEEKINAFQFANKKETLKLYAKTVQKYKHQLMWQKNKWIVVLVLLGLLLLIIKYLL